jgi:cation diffusion facilitator CzcD-associated flavoprotein CzcO
VFSSGYYQAIQRSNVKLVSERINSFARDGALTADGRLHKLDVLILATGFHGDAFMRPMSVVGENGIRIDEVWSAKPIAYRATSIPHMPNFFMLIGPYSPIASASVIEIAEWQVGFIMSCIDLVRTRKSHYPRTTPRRSNTLPLWILPRLAPCGPVGATAGISARTAYLVCTRGLRHSIRPNWRNNRI